MVRWEKAHDRSVDHLTNSNEVRVVGVENLKNSNQFIRRLTKTTRKIP